MVDTWSPVDGLRAGKDCYLGRFSDSGCGFLKTECVKDVPWQLLHFDVIVENLVRHEWLHKEIVGLRPEDEKDELCENGSSICRPIKIPLSSTVQAPLYDSIGISLLDRTENVQILVHA